MVLARRVDQSVCLGAEGTKEQEFAGARRRIGPLARKERVDRRTQIFSRMGSVKNLPSLPHVLVRLMEVCGREESTIRDIARVMDKDSSLSARVMKLINSSFYNLRSRVTNLEQALALLGVDAVKNMAISAAVYQAFARTAGDAIFKMKRFWWHSLMCATAAKLIAARTLYPSPAEAFLSGLLHDIGRVILWVHVPEYAGILQRSGGRSIEMPEEKAGLGVHHGEVGAWLVGQWNLQSFMADAVRYHHEPIERIRDASPLVQIVFVANVLSTPEKSEEERLEAANRLFGFSPADVDDIIQRAQDEVAAVAQSLDIEVDAATEEETGRSDKDLEKQQELTGRLKDRSLLQGTLYNLVQATDASAVLRSIYQGLQILLDVHDVLFFIYDEERQILVPQTISRGERLIEIVVPCREDKSLIARSLLNGRMLDTLEDRGQTPLTIIDEQLIRLLKKEGMACVPMIAQKQRVGVVVLGLDREKMPDLRQDQNLLQLLAQQGALALHAGRVREQEARKIQAERATASAAVARKVVHEVNNPLGIIRNYLNLLKMQLPDDAQRLNELRIINEEIDRIAQMMKELAEFSEPHVRKTEPVDINALIADLAMIMKGSLLKDSGTRLHLALESSLPVLISDKNGVKQALINLINNAAEAVTGGGNIYVRTRFLAAPLATRKGREAGHDLGGVEITVRDDGPGIPETVLSRLFEPYVSSKGEGHAGLGLSVVYNTIHALGGSISCRSGRTQGTVFTVLLPMTGRRGSLSGEMHV
jgi:HD-like signal output (HDOD) protein/nitrogen-specific signal transduction histidine kinase